MPTLLQTKRLGWGVIFVVVTVMGLLTYSSGRRYLAAVQAVEHTLAVQTTINSTLSLLKDAETGQRGFLLSGDPKYLEPYEAARREIPPLFARLDAITRADTAQHRRWEALRTLIDLKYSFIEETLRQRHEGDITETLRLVQSGLGKSLMDEIRVTCASMLDAEERTLANRKRDAQRAQGVAIVSIAAGSALTIALALLSLLTVNRDVSELKQVAEELAKSEAHYRLLTEQSSDLVRLLSLGGSVTYVSPSVERILGYTAKEYLELSPLSLMHPDELDLAREILAEIRSGKAREGVSTIGCGISQANFAGSKCVGRY